MSMLFSSSAPRPAPCTTSGLAHRDSLRTGVASELRLQRVFEVSQNAPTQIRTVSISMRDFIVQDQLTVSGQGSQALINGSHPSCRVRLRAARINDEVGEVL